MAGINDILEEMRAKCQKCHGALDLSEFADELFKRILSRLEQGERVQISGFGSFTARYVGDRKIQGFGGPTTMKGRRIIRYRASPHAKAIVNNEEPPPPRDRTPKKKKGKKKGGKR